MKSLTPSPPKISPGRVTIEVFIRSYLSRYTRTKLRTCAYCCSKWFVEAVVYLGGRGRATVERYRDVTTMAKKTGDGIVKGTRAQEKYKIIRSRVSPCGSTLLSGNPQARARGCGSRYVGRRGYRRGVCGLSYGCFWKNLSLRRNAFSGCSRSVVPGPACVPLPPPHSRIYYAYPPITRRLTHRSAWHDVIITSPPHPLSCARTNVAVVSLRPTWSQETLADGHRPQPGQTFRTPLSPTILQRFVYIYIITRVQQNL